MSEGPILHLYKYGRKQNCIQTPVKQGYGAILLQEAEDGKLHPVYYMSKNKYSRRKPDGRFQLEEFDYEIKHRAGSRMKHVDALSRYPVMMNYLSDRGSAFTSKLFNDYCDEENIQHLQIATGVPRENGQVERIHRTLIPVLTKLSLDDSTKWYKYVDRLQRILNSTISVAVQNGHHSNY
ncbi:retrovirus-related Pol polyprotein from transposon 17.6 [Trichonephila clavipes]|nr:retrovirus-related Pol polyprotein from transposon 17.6 [Trichonephila clavipes]